MKALFINNYYAFELVIEIPKMSFVKYLVVISKSKSNVSAVSFFSFPSKIVNFVSRICLLKSNSGNLEIYVDRGREIFLSPSIKEILNPSNKLSEMNSGSLA